MATLQQLLTQYAAYQQRNIQDIGIRLPSGVQGPDGYVPCGESPYGCGEIVGKTAIPGTQYWMPGTVQQQPSTIIQPPTSVIPTTTPAQTTDIAALHARVRQELLEEARRQLALLLSSLDAASSDYQRALTALQAGVDPVVDAELRRLDAINDPAQLTTAEAEAISRIDAAALQAWRAWAASVGASSGAQAAIQQATQMMASGGGSLRPSMADASAATLSLSALPGTDTVVSWYKSIRAAFLAAPAELRDDMARTNALRTLGEPGNPALDGLDDLTAAFQRLLGDWSTAAVSATQVDDAISGPAALTTAAVSQAVALAAVLSSFFARKAAAEAQLDVTGELVLSPDEYQRWRVMHANPLGVATSPLVLAGGAALLAALFLRRRR